MTRHRRYRNPLNTFRNARNASVCKVGQGLEEWGVRYSKPNPHDAKALQLHGVGRFLQ